jgi:hypothetical protein
MYSAAEGAHVIRKDPSRQLLGDEKYRDSIALSNRDLEFSNSYLLYSSSHFWYFIGPPFLISDLVKAQRN